MNRNKALAFFFSFVTIGALNETLSIFMSAENRGKWQAKAIAGVFTLAFATVAGYFWRKTYKQKGK